MGLLDAQVEERYRRADPARVIPGRRKWAMPMTLAACSATKTVKRRFGSDIANSSFSRIMAGISSTTPSRMIDEWDIGKDAVMTSRFRSLEPPASRTSDRAVGRLTASYQSPFAGTRLAQVRSQLTRSLTIRYDSAPLPAPWRRRSPPPGQLEIHVVLKPYAIWQFDHGRLRRLASRPCRHRSPGHDLSHH
jgi:hypothetical protein